MSETTPAAPTPVPDTEVAGAENNEVRQIPAVIQVTQSPAVTDARDKLLEAISREALLVVEKVPGQASKALLELAHAYALVTTGTSGLVGLAKSVQGISPRGTNFTPGDYTGAVTMMFDAVPPV